ncbi:MAG TPA: hypothetical protein P5055_22755, partial [Candidatus Paceibacterota bacterium]|nr:hypothetical protein [Candidatus Paceibacterota bacterium]
MQKLIPVLAGAPPGQMRGPREGVYPLRYSTDRGTKQMAWWRPAPQGWGDLARWLRCSSVTEDMAMLLRRASPASQIPSSKI